MKTGLVSVLAIVAFFAFAASSASAAEPPTVTIDPNPTAGYTTVEVSGEVDPKGEESTSMPNIVWLDRWSVA